MLRARTLLMAAAFGVAMELLALSPRALGAPRKCLESIHDPPPAIVAPPLVDGRGAVDWPALLNRFGPGVFGGLETMFPPPTLDVAALASTNEPPADAPHAPVRLAADIRDAAALASGPPQAATWFSATHDTPAMLVIPEPGMSVLILAGSVMAFARGGGRNAARLSRASRPGA
ncbi:MAG: hypothetical protein AB7Q17_09615 [Phycisphaerae bacterium]